MVLRPRGLASATTAVLLFSNPKSDAHKPPTDPYQLSAPEEGSKWAELRAQPDMQSLPGVKAVWPPSDSECKAHAESTRVLAYSEPLQTLYEILIPAVLNEQVLSHSLSLCSFAHFLSPWR
jgi:hypothetical protein